MSPTNGERWRRWISRHLLYAIRDDDHPDPVPLFDERDGNLGTHERLDEYRYGRNDGDYLYLLYTLQGPADDPESVRPIYVGESRNISNRLRQHSRKLRDALPVASWTDDGSRGSWGKYDHMAVVHERLDTPLYAWICDVDTLEKGPYGYPTYRQELEAQLVGLIRSQPRFHATFTNREFVPNRILQQMGAHGPDWIDVHEPRSLPTSRERSLPEGDTKADCWEAWVKRYMLADIESQERADPIPLFDTTDSRRVRLNEMDRLKRSEAIDRRIREAGRRCVHADGLRDTDHEGLLYVLYQFDTDHSPVDSGIRDASAIVPRYIGKAEASGTTNELSNNFKEIAREQSSTKRFARWGDGDYWHTGQLSMALFDGDSRKRLWAAELFEDGTRRLTDEVYLWVHAWDPSTDIGPYGYHTHLAAVEPLLIGTAYDAAPDHLLNKDGVPDDAPANMRTPSIETVSVQTPVDEQRSIEDVD